AVGCRPSRAQGSSNQCALGNFLARGTCRFRAFYVPFDAVWTLGRNSNTQCDQLAVFSRNGAVLTANDVIQAEPGVEFRGGEFAHLLEKPQIADIMVVFAHLVLL